jgi:hypothetical protein
MLEVKARVGLKRDYRPLKKIQKLITNKKIGILSKLLLPPRNPSRRSWLTRRPSMRPELVSPK